jgi:hypothetical protein
MLKRLITLIAFAVAAWVMTIFWGLITTNSNAAAAAHETAIGNWDFSNWLLSNFGYLMVGVLIIIFLTVFVITVRKH